MDDLDSKLAAARAALAGESGDECGRSIPAPYNANF